VQHATRVKQKGSGMAWTETYHCDVCNSPRKDVEDWWLAWTDQTTPPNGSPQDALRFTRWNHALSHGAEIKHLCGARCAQTFMDRWMSSEDARR
jgi:hypothetical protein